MEDIIENLNEEEYWIRIVFNNGLIEVLRCNTFFVTVNDQGELTKLRYTESRKQKKQSLFINIKDISYVSAQKIEDIDDQKIPSGPTKR